MTTKIRCSYEDCDRHFKSHEAMIRHKVKDAEHFYCKRCDVDCEDDLNFMLHQIESAKHICCPVCGKEFDSTAGRDDHVERSHVSKQTLECVGCQARLAGAAAYMAHIEEDKCEVITLEHYQRQRAEKKIQKDQWEEMLNPTGALYLSSNVMPSDADTNGGVPILDDYQSHPGDVWPHSSELGSGPAALHSVTSNRNLGTSMANLSLNKFPPLPLEPQHDRQKLANKETIPHANNGDLMSFQDPKDRTLSKESMLGAQKPWNTSESVHRLLFPAGEKQLPFASDVSDSSAHNNMTMMTASTHHVKTQTAEEPRDPTASHHSSNLATKRGECPSSIPSIIPPAARAQNQDPNARHTQVRSVTKISRAPTIDPMNYYDDLLDQFVCSGYNCGRKFDTPDEFVAHLTTGVHVGGKVTCPSCLSRFQSTAALITHCESNSKKCNINKSVNYNQVLRQLTGGLIGTDGHRENGAGVKYVANKVEDW